ncbi:PREDICTED: cytoplasmic tRNA 2-thiolation protein 1-like [Branchiostoma belcheri]|uniref:Cytoplasmic tRNA 2-thiolation protein 1 n=1 Tax=Branchiostoma belcheri TaxID=7741 RepID=A0A6P4ZM58_BRABE|nr:PREDICTED: cytoplasmic tRNA 2-thiolation protein 1-like [Branchiostoma belcheri]
MPISCGLCEKRAMLKRPKTGGALCKECFFTVFEAEVHQTITSASLFKRGETVAIAASGGKDSTVLAHLMKLLNHRHDYGLNLILLSVDEGITGYRDDSLETVKRNQQQYELPLKVVSYKELYGWTMDEIVRQIGLKNNCTFCGVFRRQALDRGAMMLGVNKIVTGHNADDVAETVIMNVLRGDIARLQRCTAIVTGTEGAIPRCKPFKYTYEKEIVMYAYFKKLDYFSTECIYSPNAYRGHARTYLKDLESIRSTSIIDIIHSGECMSVSVKKDVKMPTQGTCARCGYISSNELCKACVLLEGLNKGLPKLGIGKPHKARLALGLTNTPDTTTAPGSQRKEGCQSCSCRSRPYAAVSDTPGCNKDNRLSSQSKEDNRLTDSIAKQEELGASYTVGAGGDSCSCNSDVQRETSASTIGVKSVLCGQDKNTPCACRKGKGQVGTRVTGDSPAVPDLDF